MSRQAKKVAEIIAGGVVLALAAALWLRRGPLLPVDPVPPADTSAPAGAATPAAGAPEAASPEQVARLFGWRRAPAPKPLPAAPSPLPAEPPAAADWLAYVGFVADTDGERFLFKDRRTGKVIPVSTVSAEWRLVESRDKELIAEYQGRLYALKRGK
jgi:hypothetical protein